MYYQDVYNTQNTSTDFDLEGDLQHCAVNKLDDTRVKSLEGGSLGMNVYCFMAHRQLRSFSAQLNLVIHDPWVNKPVLG